MEFEEWYTSYADNVYSYLMFKLNDCFLAEDLLQETFLSAYAQSLGPNRPEKVKAWLLTIAHHKMVDRLRKSRGSPEQTLIFEAENTVSALQQRDASSDQLIVQEMLMQLEPTARDIVYLVYVEGYTFCEAARILKIPEGTAKSTGHYAKKKLRSLLRQGGGGDP